MENTTAILQLMMAKGLGAVKLNRLLSALKMTSVSAQDFVLFSEEEMTTDFGLNYDTAKSIEDSKEQADQLSCRLSELEINVVINKTDYYPDKLSEALGNNSPPLLFVKGDISILKKPGIGFTGARNSSETGLRIASESAAYFAELGMNIISGYAQGVDLAAHQAALDTGGVTTMVLAEGIFNFSLKGDVKELIDDSKNLILSEFPPNLPWKSHNAMRRNYIICGLSDAVILVESGKTGGTFSAGKTTMELRRPLFAVEYDKPVLSAEGNDYFLKRGAHPLHYDESGKLNLDDVTNAIDNEAEKQTTLNL